MRVDVIIVAVVLATGGCATTHDEAEVRIRVGTALKPSVDFIDVVTTLGDDPVVRYHARAADPFDVPVTPNGDPGQLCAVFEDVSTRVPTALDVQLLDAAGTVVRDFTGNLQPDVHTRATNYFFRID